MKHLIKLPNIVPHTAGTERAQGEETFSAPRRNRPANKSNVTGSNNCVRPTCHENNTESEIKNISEVHSGAGRGCGGGFPQHVSQLYAISVPGLIRIRSAPPAISFYHPAEGLTVRY